MAKTPYTNIYDSDYFDGPKMFLYIGDVWVDEITSLEYVTRQAKMPIYGYASHLFDDVTPGRVMVEGRFTINYKEQGYLWAVLRRYFEIYESKAYGSSENSQASNDRDRALMEKHNDFQRLENGKIIPGAGTQSPLVGSNGTRISRANIERLISGEAGRTERYDFYNQVGGFATVSNKNAKDRIFEDIVQVFEDQVWTHSQNNTLDSQIRRTDHNRFDGFDMYVVFGDYSNPGANHTVQKIMGVRLLSQSKMIQIDGSPIQEEYTFIAKSTA